MSLSVCGSHADSGSPVGATVAAVGVAEGSEPGIVRRDVVESMQFSHAAVEPGHGVGEGGACVSRCHRRVFEVIGPCSQFRWPWQLQFPDEFRAVRDMPLDGVQDGERVEPDGGGEAFGLPVPFGFGEPGDDRGGFLQGVEPFFDAPTRRG